MKRDELPLLETPATTPKSVTFRGDFSKKLVTNTFFNVLGRCWSFVVALLLTPFILSHLKTEEFGTWVLIGVFINWFNLLDLGLGFSFVKYISEYYTLKDFDRVNRTIASGLLFYLLFGGGIVVIMLVVERPLLDFLSLAYARDVYWLVLLSFAVNNIAGMFMSVIRGTQRMDKSNSVEIKMGLLQILGTVIALQLGYGMFGLAVNALVQALVLTALSWWTVKQIIPEARLVWRLEATSLRAMFSYSAQIQVSRLGGLVCFQMDKFIISGLLGMAAVSFYEVSSRLASFMRAVPLVMISALIPATSELEALNDREKILKTYTLASRYVAMLTVGLASFLVIEARTVVQLWLGSGFDQSVLLVQILAIGYAANILGGAASQTGAGIGRPDFDMKGTIILIVLNPILSLVLASRFGAAGAAAGTSIALAVAAIYLVLLFQRSYVQRSIFEWVNETLLRTVLSGVLASLAVLAMHNLVPAVVEYGEARWPSIIKLMIDGSVFSGVYVLVLILFRQVTTIDRANFLGLLTFGFEFLRHPVRQRVKIYR